MKLPPVRKRENYNDLAPDDLTFALFYDRVLDVGSMREDRAFDERAQKVRLLELELELLQLKHGKHNQATHGKKGRAGQAGAAAYASARAGGAGHSEALQAQRAATQAERQTIRQEGAQRRTERLQTQAQRARAAANGGQVTEAQRAALLQKADRLDARARGERVGPAQKPQPVAARTSEQVTRDFYATEREAKNIGAALSRANSTRSSLDPDIAAESKRQIPILRAQLDEVKARRNELFNTTIYGSDGKRIPIETASLSHAAEEWDTRRVTNTLRDHPASRDMLRDRIVSEVIPQGTPNRAQAIADRIAQGQTRLRDLDAAQYRASSGDERARIQHERLVERGITAALMSQQKRDASS